MEKQSEELKEIVDIKLHSFYHFLKHVDKSGFAKWTVLNQAVKEIHKQAITDLKPHDEVYLGLCKKYKENFVFLSAAEKDSMRVKLEDYKENLKKAEIICFLMNNMSIFMIENFVKAVNAYNCHNKKKESWSWESFGKEKPKNEFDALVDNTVLTLIVKLMSGMVLNYNSSDLAERNEAFCCAKLMCILSS